MTIRHTEYDLALRDHDMLPVIAYGTAGSGKTYGAIGFATEWLKTKNRKVVVTRPNVSFAQELGFLPGTEREKMEPWIRPIEQNFAAHGIHKGALESLEKHGILTYLPLEYIQGLTFDNSLIIVDECFRDGAEVLTKRGFIDFKDLTEDDFVAQYEESGDISFVKPSRTIEKYYEGEMVTTVSDRFYSSVTPNHRKVYLDSGKHLKVLLAKEGFKRCWKVPLTGSLVGGESFNKDVISLACMLQADGNANCKKGAYYWKVSFSKERKIAKCRELVKRLGIDYSEYSEDCRGKTTFYLGRHEELIGELLSLPNKTFNKEFFLKLDKECLSYFQDELLSWDGSVKGRARVYCTTNLENAELAQTIAPLLGVTANICKSVDSRKESYKDYYRVHFSNRTYASLQGKEDIREYYKGKVRCVTVPSGMIVVRQEGCIQISGNCQNMSLEQMKVLLTRQGKWSKLVMCGDIAQTSPKFKNSGLKELLRLIEMTNIQAHTIEFFPEDILRSKQCKAWIEAFDSYDLMRGILS